MKLPFQIDLTGKTSVITGGSGVLCSCMAHALAACGSKVAIISLHQEKAEKTAASIRKEGGIAIGLAANVLDETALRQAKKEIIQKFGVPSILINGAGGNNACANTEEEHYHEGVENARTFFELDLQGFTNVFDLNVKGALLTTQVFAPEMTNQKDACVINISSMSAFHPLTKIPAYSAAKAALSNLTEWMSTYFAPCGLRVNAIAPGFFITEQNKDLLFDAQGNPTARTEKILRSTPAGRFGEPEELIGTLLWLVCPEASRFVSGIVVPVDGGFNTYSGV